MTEHPITPPPELVTQWIQQYGNSEDPRWQAYEQDIATQAARWGANQELEACCEWLEQNCGRWDLPAALRDARRPKPPSLKEQALAKLAAMERLWEASGNEPSDLVRRALELLND